MPPLFLMCLITQFVSVLGHEETALESVVVSLLQQISQLKAKTENQMDSLRNEMDAMKKELVNLKAEKCCSMKEMEELRTQQVDLRAKVDILFSKPNAQNSNLEEFIPDADFVNPVLPLIADDMKVYGTEESGTDYKTGSFRTNDGDVSSSTIRTPDLTQKGKGNKQKDLNAEQSQKKNGISTIQRIRRSVENEVAFFAYLGYQANNLGAFQNIVFDRVVTNIGNAYNWNHGIFVAPVNGTYVFSLTLMAVGSMTWGHLVVNRQVVAKVELGEKNASSQTIVVALKAGDDVSVQNTYTDRKLIGDNYSTFCGFLLY